MTRATRLAGSAAVLALVLGGGALAQTEEATTDEEMMSEEAMSEDEMMSEDETMSDDAMAEEGMMADEGMMQSGEPVMVGGAPMFASKTIVENAVNSQDHTTLVAAVKAAGLVDTLSGPGPFTVFAPTNDAFARLPEGTVEALLQPENKDALTGVLTYHVVPRELNATELANLVEANGGEAELTTVSGGTLSARAADGGLVIVDDQGNAAAVTIPNVMQSNGVIHVVNSVLLPG